MLLNLVLLPFDEVCYRARAHHGLSAHVLMQPAPEMLCAAAGMLARHAGAAGAVTAGIYQPAIWFNAAGGEYDSSDSSPGCQPSSPVDGDCMFSVEELQRLRGEHGNAAVTATFLRWPRSASIGRTASTVSARATYRSLG